MSNDRTLPSNEDNDNLVAELEAAAGVWLLNKNKYTLESLRDARRAVLQQMQPPTIETCDPRCSVCSAPLTVSVVCSDRCARRANELKANTLKASSEVFPCTHLGCNEPDGSKCRHWPRGSQKAGEQ